MKPSIVEDFEFIARRYREITGDKPLDEPKTYQDYDPDEEDDPFVGYAGDF